MPDFNLLFRAVGNVFVSIFKNFWPFIKEASSVAFGFLLFFAVMFGFGAIGAYLMSFISPMASGSPFVGIAFIGSVIIGLFFNLFVLKEYDNLIFKKKTTWLA